ncbi:hypothetical protein GGF43_004130 [Coemansia sp. RSA 2618]|nr:hypothetical protein GGF43_004130 [Coemansia sp. RSA 2618]
MTGSYTWFNPRLMSVSFGPDVYDVRQALISDGFKHESFAHNVGLIILASPVPDSVATPVKIYSGSLATSTHVVAAGFGLTGRSTNPYPTRPHVAPLSIMDHRNCSAFAGFDSSTQLCVEGASGADLCMGDEGAPLLVTGSEEHSVALLGVASYITKSASSSGSRLVMCGGNGNVAYFEMSRSWAQWISKVAHVTYNDIIISLNITTDSDKHHAGNSSLYSQSMSDASDGVAEGPLSVSESVLESGGGKLVSLALDAAFAAIVFAAIL